MKSSAKARLASVLGTVGALLQKCGGPGGTPGVCPTGAGKKPPAGGGKLRDIQRTDAHAASKKAMDKTYAASASMADTGKRGVLRGHAYSAHHHASMSLRQDNGSKAMKDHHASAMEFHTKAAAIHNAEAGNAHKDAAKLHMKAAAVHKSHAGLS